MALRQKPDHLHVARFDRVRAVHETMLQLRHTQVIRHARHAEPSYQADKLRRSQRKRNPIQAESIHRIPYEANVARHLGSAGRPHRVVASTEVVGFWELGRWAELRP